MRRIKIIIVGIIAVILMIGITILRQKNHFPEMQCIYDLSYVITIVGYGISLVIIGERNE